MAITVPFFPWFPTVSISNSATGNYDQTWLKHRVAMVNI